MQASAIFMNFDFSCEAVFTLYSSGFMIVKPALAGNVFALLNGVGDLAILDIIYFLRYVLVYVVI